MRSNTNNEVPCTICASPCDRSETRKMVYQLAWCKSSTCKELAIYVKCSWRGEICTCKETGLVSEYELSAHVSSVNSTKSNQLTRPMRACARNMAEQEIKPARIRINPYRSPQPGRQERPKLIDVQNCVSSYRRKHMSNSDLIDTLMKLAQTYCQSPSMTDEDPLAFGFELDVYNNPILGEGTDKNPFIFDLTSL